MFLRYCYSAFVVKLIALLLPLLTPSKIYNLAFRFCFILLHINYSFLKNAFHIFIWFHVNWNIQSEIFGLTPIRAADIGNARSALSSYHEMIRVTLFSFNAAYSHINRLQVWNLPLEYSIDYKGWKKPHQFPFPAI